MATDVVDLADEADQQFVHGDFGLHNLHWSGDRIGGLLDLDHAARGDPAIDVAPLVGAFGGRLVAQVVQADVLHRARIHRATLALQVAAAAHLVDDVGLRDHALRNFVARHTAGTLYDPDGASPSGG